MKKKIKFKGECWVWQYAKNSGGYGQFQKDKVCYQAHKYMYELIKGAIPANCELDHLCRNRLCINPEHLEPVSHAENCRRGNQTKLSKEDVKEIRKLSATHTHQKIADKFKVSRQSISLILQGKRWV